MAKYSQGDIVLLPYPFTDLSDTKQRPVVIISKDAINKQNMIVAKITSVIRNDPFSFSIRPIAIDLELRRKSEVRTNEVFTVHKSLMKKKVLPRIGWVIKIKSFPAPTGSNIISHGFQPVVKEGMGYSFGGIFFPFKSKNYDKTGF